MTTEAEDRERLVTMTMHEIQAVAKNKRICLG